MKRASSWTLRALAHSMVKQAKTLRDLGLTDEARGLMARARALKGLGWNSLEPARIPARIRTR